MVHRRDFLRLTAMLALPILARAQGRRLAPTPACDSDEPEAPTPRQTEGPFYKPRSPRRSSLIDEGLQGARLVVSGRVWTTDCRPLAGVILDFWQADSEGEYDNAGFRLRGHQLSDERGNYRLETIVPGNYGRRTRHIHVKLARGSRDLTTQLYFPGEAANQKDSLFDPRLLLAGYRPGNPGARFDFVLAP